MKNLLKVTKLPKPLLLGVAAVMVVVGIYMVYRSFAGSLLNLPVTVGGVLNDPHQASPQLRTSDGTIYKLSLQYLSEGLPANQQVKVTGIMLPGNILVVKSPDDIEGSSPSESVTVTPSYFGEKKMGVVLFKFQNTSAIDLSTLETKTTVQQTLTSFAETMAEYSLGKLTYRGKYSADFNQDIFGRVTIPYNNAGCDTRTWKSAARQLVQNQGVNLDGYDYLIFASPHTQCTSLTGLLGVKEPYHNGAVSFHYHDIFHGFSLGHANAWSCQDLDSGKKIAIGRDYNCGYRERWDPFEVLGSGNGHFSNHTKAMFGWIPAANVKTVTSDGNYILYSSTFPSSGTQVLRIPRKIKSGSVYQYLYIELRQPAKHESYWQRNPASTGVYIRLGYQLERGRLAYPSAALLDMTPGSKPNATDMYDSDLGLGQTFSDSYTGITITLKSKSLNNVSLSIKAGKPIASSETTPPSEPTNFRATGSTCNSTSLAWNPSTDASGIAAYKLTQWGRFDQPDNTQISEYENGVISTKATSYTFANLNSDSYYAYWLGAYDNNDNTNYISFADLIWAKTKPSSSAILNIALKC